jgi:hypothetical protein
MSINSFFNTISVSRYSRPITVTRDPLQHVLPTVRSYEYARVNIEFFTGRKKIKQRRISFVLGYLRMILWLHIHVIALNQSCKS